MAKYSLTPVKDLGAWDAFNNRSPQQSIFSHSRYLEAMGRKYKLYFVYQGQQIKAGVSLVLRDDGLGCELDDLVIYNGILFDELELCKPAKARMERFELTKFILDALDDQFNGIEMSLSPAFEDLRPFSWHNFHSPLAHDKYIINLRYTSRLDISEFFLCKDDASTFIYKNLDKNRQSDICKAQGNVFFEETRAIGRFIEYYNVLFLSQGKTVSPEKLSRMKNLIDSIINDGLARMYAVKNSHGHPTYMTVFTVFKNKGCYLFAAGDIATMSRYDGTYCVWESMKALSRHGVHEVDLEGVNSPQRGAFKIGFGGDLWPYFKVIKRPVHD
jgi:hypothetical protein